MFNHLWFQKGQRDPASNVAQQLEEKRKEIEEGSSEYHIILYLFI